MSKWFKAYSLSCVSESINARLVDVLVKKVIQARHFSL